MPSLEHLKTLSGIPPLLLEYFQHLEDRLAAIEASAFVKTEPAPVPQAP